MEIKQILQVHDIMYGLADDNKMYRWDFASASWVPHWKVAGTTASPS